jgi:uncharacterized protein (DUF433 family)
MISAMNYAERIVRDAQIVGGEPVLKATRVTLTTVLASLAKGATSEEILADFPTLSEEDVRAALDPGDWLDDEDHAALHTALRDSEDDVKAGRLVDADAILRELRSR